jgi:hypothetical protein
LFSDDFICTIAIRDEVLRVVQSVIVATLDIELVII